MVGLITVGLIMVGLFFPLLLFLPLLLPRLPKPTKAEFEPLNLPNPLQTHAPHTTPELPNEFEIDSF